MTEKEYFVIYNPENDKFLLDKTSPGHHPYTWVEGESGMEIMAIPVDMLDRFIDGKYETAFHVIKFLKSTCPDDGIMIIPLNMINEARSTFDFKHGFKL